MAAGLRLIGEEDLSRRVRRTSLMIARRVAARLVTSRRFRRLVRPRGRAFALPLPRLILAYLPGATRPGLFVCEKRS